MPVTVRRTQTAPRVPVPYETARQPNRAADWTAKPIIGSIYEVRYEATRPRVQGIGFAATRDIVSHLRSHGDGVHRAADHAHAGFRHLPGRSLLARSYRPGLQRAMRTARGCSTAC